MLEWNYKGKKGVINSYVLCSVLEDMVIMSSKKKRFYGWVTVILIVVGTVLSLRVSFMSQAVGLLAALDYNGYCYDSEKFILGFGVSELRSVVSQDEFERLVDKNDADILCKRREGENTVLYLDATKRCKQWASGINYYLNYRDKAVRVEIDDEGCVISIQLADCDEAGIRS